MNANLELLTVKQASDLTGYSESTLYRMIEAQAFPVRRFGRTIRIRRAILEAWILAPEQGDPARLPTSGKVLSITARTGAGSPRSS